MLNKTYQCQMCGFTLKITKKLMEERSFKTQPLCAECIKKNPEIEIEYMEPYIKMKEVK